MTPKLEEKLFAKYDAGAGPSLSRLCAELLANQKETWPELAAGCETLRSVRLREIQGAAFSVQVQFNPGRMASSAAPVDPESIRKRPCFLCFDHLPSAQRAVLYGGEFLVLCNPAPIFPGHYTVSALRHVPQAIVDHIGAFLSLAQDLSGEFIIFYNGPRCGASAPDHFHFQAAPAGAIPIEKTLAAEGRKKRIGSVGNVALFRGADLGREVLVLEGRGAAGIEAVLRDLIGEMKTLLAEPGEPMMNVLCSHGPEGWRLTLFPRRSHRPRAFYRSGNGQLLISPGSVDMGGLLIAPRERDFETLDAAAVETIFREVSLDGETALRAAEALLERRR